MRKLFPMMVWEMDRTEKKIYLTFDDGPHPVQTPFVLDLLKQYNAKATFFCIGNNVRLYPEIYKRIIEEGHSVGNHTQNHLNGKKTNDKIFIDDVREAGKYIDSNLFRPPYGRIKRFQTKVLTELRRPYKIIMWTVLSGDFDPGISKQRSLENVLFNTGPGSIVVFHDSEKAADKVRYVLPLVLQTYCDKKYVFERISEENIGVKNNGPG